MRWVEGKKHRNIKNKIAKELEGLGYRVEKECNVDSIEGSDKNYYVCDAVAESGIPKRKIAVEVGSLSKTKREELEQKFDALLRVQKNGNRKLLGSDLSVKAIFNEKVYQTKKQKNPIEDVRIIARSMLEDMMWKKINEIRKEVKELSCYHCKSKNIELWGARYNEKSMRNYHSIPEIEDFIEIYCKNCDGGYFFSREKHFFMDRYGKKITKKEKKFIESNIKGRDGLTTCSLCNKKKRIVQKDRKIFTSGNIISRGVFLCSDCMDDINDAERILNKHDFDEVKKLVKVKARMRGGD